MKSYSRLSVREKIDADLERVDADLIFYADDEYKVARLAAEKERLLQRADHYDREQAAGYKHPTTHRWKNDETMGGEFRSQTINLDED
jgi:hypothetical protein